MQKKLALQMDPIESIRFQTDSSLILGIEAEKRGYEVFYYTPRDAYFKDGTLFAHLARIHLRYEEKNYFTLEASTPTPLSEMNIILMRQDPPFDMNYLTYTYWLETLPHTTRVLNPPAQVRNHPEKLFATEFKEFTPSTLIGSNLQAITEFYREHRDIILKPLYSFGGNDVFHLPPETDNIEGFASALIRLHGNVPIIAQEFLPNIRTDGDARIILINGKIAGALRRIPIKQSIRSNTAAGGKFEAITLTPKQTRIAETVGETLKKHKIMLAGIDVIGEYLTEINITSPTGLQLVNRLENKKLETMFWDEVEKEQ